MVASTATGIAGAGVAVPLPRREIGLDEVVAVAGGAAFEAGLVEAGFAVEAGLAAREGGLDDFEGGAEPIRQSILGCAHTGVLLGGMIDKLVFEKSTRTKIVLAAKYVDA